MKPNAEVHVEGFNRAMSEEEVLSHLAELRHRAAMHTPILDDDDYEAAIDEAAREIAGEPVL
ncbi:hypothetical protein PS467_00185 [Streptomyces luomodiensis]|uniref:Uncharacterized protein n=1 Tax=Streptomyces luomodiensis TaxID=3026192 RepID=A0ABY9UPL0_9ACTN|nr:MULTISPECIES: hypothetical protein [unclassified Streptomyces]WAP55051.1 hypothetical protein N6H00_08670 [Streptomyces sp. S465]WNE93870.1 hypothetical protein PS467_00185 [Streptomyces sp. SCA4-21]